MKKNQQGYVFVFYLVAIAIGIILLMQNYVFRVNNDNFNTPAEKEKYIKNIGDSIYAWYDNNAWDIDSDVNAIPSADIQSQAALVPYYGLQVASSKQLTKDNISYHVIVAWLPTTDVTGTSFDPDTGIFTAGTPESALHYYYLNGYNIEIDKVSKTEKKVSVLAKLLEGWFEGRVSSASYSEIGENWFRTPSCVSPNSRYLPCADTLTDASTLLSTQGIIDTNTLLNAWGQPIQVLNTTPYLVNIHTNTPWGTSTTGLAQGSY